MFKVLLDLAELVHQMLQLRDAVIVEKDTIEFSSAVWVFVFFHNRTAVVAHALDDGLDVLPDFRIVSDVVGKVSVLVLRRMITASFFDQISNARFVSLLRGKVQGRIPIDIDCITINYHLIEQQFADIYVAPCS